MNKDSPFLYQGGIFRQRRGDGAGAGAPAYPRFVGAAPREQVVSLGSSLPEVGAGGPHTPMRGRSAPPPRRDRREGRCPSALPEVGAAPPRPLWGGRSAPPPRVTFPSRGKSPKARQGLRPLESPGARFSPFSRSLTHRAGLVCATEKDRFATLRWWANRSLLFPLALTRKNILLLIRGAGAFSCTFRCNFWGDSGYR